MGLSFAELTGRSDYERQSWRDSYHGGKPAGDWSGGVAARLEWERATYGATVSGSSREYSASELWQIRASGDTGAIARDKSERRASQQGRAPASAGPGNPTVAAVSHKGPHPVPTGGAGVGGVASGAPGAITGPGAPVAKTGPKGGSLITFGTPPLKQKVKDSATGGHVGLPVHANPWFSDVEEFWEPRYGEPGEWAGGFVNMFADLVYGTAGHADAFHSTVKGWEDAWNSVDFDKPSTHMPKESNPMAPMGQPASLHW